MEAIPLSQFDQSLHVPLGLHSEAFRVNLLLQTQTQQDVQRAAELQGVKMGFILFQ